MSGLALIEDVSKFARSLEGLDHHEPPEAPKRGVVVVVLSSQDGCGVSSESGIDRSRLPVLG
jgi:hypothetical protein